jgi:hypothetical protein
MDLIPVVCVAESAKAVDKGGKDLVGIWVPTGCPDPGDIVWDSVEILADEDVLELADISDVDGNVDIGLPPDFNATPGTAMVWAPNAYPWLPSRINLTWDNSITGTFYLLARDFR